MHLGQVVTLYHPTGPLLPRHWAFIPATAADGYGGGSGAGGDGGRQLLLLTDKKASAIYSLDVSAEPGARLVIVFMWALGQGGAWQGVLSHAPMADKRLFPADERDAIRKQPGVRMVCAVMPR